MGRSRSTRPNTVLALLVVTALLIAGMWTWFPSHVSAHADHIGGYPSHGERIATPPTEILLEFSEAIQSGSVRVVDPDGERVDQERLHIDPNNQRLIRVPLQNTGTGVYTVRWEVLSVDGHTTSGSYLFSVGEPISREELLTQFADATETFPGSVDDIDVTLRLTPLEVGVNVMTVLLQQDGEPVDAAEVQLLTYQSAAGLYPPKYELDAVEPGLYSTIGAFAVPGDWVFQLTLRLEDAVKAVRFEVEVPSAEQDRATRP